MLARLLVLGTILIGSCNGKPKMCDVDKDLVTNESFSLYSPDYPSKYPAGTLCRWYYKSPPDTRISFMCDNVSIPSSLDCERDRLSVSRDGRKDLNDAEHYCGRNRINIFSNKNEIYIQLSTVYYSVGGSFTCQLVVIDSPPPANPNCPCGYTNSMRLLGGIETGVNEYPMMAALINIQDRKQLCGATIISMMYSLTTARCVLQKNPRTTGLLVGDHDRTIENDTYYELVYTIEKFLPHPKYNSITHRNDIALVKVKDKIKFSRLVGPACLPFLNTNNSFAGETVQAVGWGTTDFKFSDVLLEASLGVMTLQQCKPTYGELVTVKQMCTFTDEKKACQSDSGGPILWKDLSKGVTKIVGIISYGIGCETPNPNVNTRVTSYLDWIKHTTGEEYCIV